MLNIAYTGGLKMVSNYHEQYKNHFFEFIIVLIILFIPFQQSLTLQVGPTIRISDILICILFPLMILASFAGKKRLIYINAFYLYLLINTVVMSYLLKAPITFGSAIVAGGNRMLINVATCAISLMAYSIGVFIGKDNHTFNKVIRLFSKIIIFLSIYVFIQFIALNTVGSWIHLPGEKLNDGTTIAYGLTRAYGFSIEPGALGNLLMFSFIFIYTFLDNGRLKKIALTVCAVAVFSSMSSIALITIITFIFLVICKKNFKTRYKIIIALLFIFMIFMLFNNSFLYSAVIDKITGDGYSKLDRLGNSQILTNMFYKYPIAGIGFGNYGALRNSYAMGTFIKYKIFYDMPNSFYYELIGEVGIIGVILFINLIFKLIKQLKKIDKNVFLFIIPFLLSIAASSSINMNYIAIGLGIIYGKYIQANNLSKETK